MNAPQFDEAWRRYLDREMGQSEEAAFLVCLSEAERAELFATGTALEALERLPRMSAPGDLAGKVMAAVKPEKQSILSRLRHWLEHRPLLGWEFAGAALAASVLFVALAPLSLTPSAGGSASPPLLPALRAAGGAGGSFQVSLYAPQAHKVELIGDFNGWGSQAEVKLMPSGKGTWSAIVPLPAGRYQYAFLVDGQRWVSDPRAEQHVNDDFGRQNAVITIM